jgi:RNA polymerase sigma-70 factor (ECF subfamily)
MDSDPFIQSLRSGDPKAFEQLFRQHYAPLCGFAAKILQDSVQAEETVQELFTQLWERRERIGPNASLQGYLYNATRNACLNHLKHMKVRAKFADHALHTPSDHDAGDALDAAELDARIQTAVAGLPERCREIFEMSRMEGLKYNEIAEKLALSPRTVEVQIGKALRVMREQLREFLPLLVGWWLWKGPWQ